MDDDALCEDHAEREVADLDVSAGLAMTRSTCEVPRRPGRSDITVALAIAVGDTERLNRDKDASASIGSQLGFAGLRRPMKALGEGAERVCEDTTVGSFRCALDNLQLRTSHRRMTPTAIGPSYQWIWGT
jgi:hypothetical protein